MMVAALERRCAPTRRWLALALLALACAGARADADGPISSVPLAPRPQRRGPTLFRALGGSETGVSLVNRFDDPRMWGDLYQEFEFGALGCGVAIGDYDGDGRPDIFVVGKTGDCRLYRNLGGYRFEDVTEKAGIRTAGGPGIWCNGATFVDIDNSGRLDIYVCRFNAPNLLFVNQGDGTFREMAHAYGLDVVDASGQASFADYDRDGRLDVYIATNLLDSSSHPNGQRGRLLHNNGNHTFTDVTAQAGMTAESQSHSASWWDYDNDGWPDLYVANDYGQPDHLYHNNRDGTFTDVIDQVLPRTSFSSMGSDTGDVRGDGRIDLLVTDMAFTSHALDQRGPAEERSKNAEPVEGDARTAKLHRNALLLNTGTPRAIEAATLAGIDATNWTWSVRLEDFDNDGRVDLFVANGMNKEENVDLTARMAMAESTAERIRIMRDSPILEEPHLAFRNTGDLRFEDVSAAWGVDQKGIAFGAATGDLSGDGNLDIVYTTYQGGVVILRNDADTGHVVNVDLRGTVSNRTGVGAVVTVESALGTQTRQLWLARGYMSSSEPMLHFGLGADTRIRRMTVTWPSGRFQSFEDLPVDRRYTITEPGAAQPRPAVPAVRTRFREAAAELGLAFAPREEAVDETQAQRLLPVRLNRRGPFLAAADLFGDGRDALVVSGTTLDPLCVYRQDASGHFRQADASFAGVSAGADDGPVLAFDAAGTGRMDLLVTKGGNALGADAPEYQPRLYLNDGHGGFRSAPEDALPPLPISAGAVAAADFLHDGRLGVFIGARLVPGQYPQAPRSALLANRGGRFEDITDTFAPGLRQVGMVTSALWSDVDGDGWPDLLVTLDWGGVRYFHNNAGRGLEDWTERSGFSSAGTGWWTSIAAIDLTHDGRLSYVVGNVGLNTPYHADRTHPALLFSGDFRGNGSSQLIEAYYEGDKLYPWRTRRDLGASIPSILKRFPRNDAYASATLEQILGPDKLAKADRYAATELQSGVLLAQPGGSFRFTPLPRIAQVAPLQGLVAGDLGDGLPCLFAAQNSFAPIPSVGPFSGGIGQLLEARGDGLEAVEPAASGLVVPGDAKAAVALEVGDDGLPSLVVGRNGSRALAFRNQGMPGCEPLVVSLRAAPGNPTAVGARVTLVFTDGSTLSQEVAASGGLSGQSSADCFLGHPASRVPAALRVRWPGGRMTETTLAKDQSRVIVNEPRP
jgi:enediyne biosynthesis protein E4